MKKLFISTILVLFAVCSVKAQQDTIKIHVDGTSLESLLEDYDKGSISYLSITGKLSEDDYAYFRGSLLQKLDVLDLKYAEIDSLPDNVFYSSQKTTISQIILPRNLKYVGDKGFVYPLNASYVITGQFPQLGNNMYYEPNGRIGIANLKISKDNIYCKEVEMLHKFYDGELINIRCICSSDTTILYYQDVRGGIPNVMEGVRIISSNVFENRMVGEGDVTYLPSTLDSIGDRAFYNINMIISTCCGPGKSHLACKAVNPPKLGKEVFKIEHSGYYTLHAYLYVPDESVELYKEADGWKNFVEIRPLGRYDPIKGGIKENIKSPNAIEIKYNEVDCTLQLSKPASRMMVYDVDGTQVLNNKITSQTIRLNKSLLGKPYSLAVIAFTDGTTEVVKLKY
ncbi:MAG: hypothetical protein J6Q57_01400 [Paraprevotella sp.]|nr:hypothetical protein [Paraprevotella sp.]